MTRMNDKDDKPLLQRRGGRRISIPSSPISPSLPKRNERTVRSLGDVNTTDHPATTDTLSDQPSIDLTFPSPMFDGPMFASDTNGDANRKPTSAHTVTTEEQERSRTIDDAENSRGTILASPVYEGKLAQPPRPTYLSDMATRSSPIIGRISEGRDRYYETSVSASRNYSTTSLATEKSASDENVSARLPTIKKSRLNLLNPMSLLARRRSSQNTKLEDMNVSVSPLHVPAIPDNFDPSIRGSFVHDFSTPRSKRSNFDNSPRREAFSSPANLRRPSDFGTPPTHHGSSPSPVLHSPMFKEHFQDDENALQPGQTAYLHNVASSRKTFDAPPQAALPSFAQRLPATIPEPGKANKQKQLPPLDIPHPDVPPPPPPKRTPSPHLDIPNVAGLPKHMTSVSSRFSFQIAGQGSSAQEKLLEERHKEHFAKDVDKPDDVKDVADDEFDDYDFDADDGFEEKIPGVNTDYEDDDGFYTDDIAIKSIDIQSSQQPVDVTGPSLHGFHFTPNPVPFTPTSIYHGSEPTPRDIEGFPIGVADTKDSPVTFTAGCGQQKLAGDTASPLFFEGLRISTVDQRQIPLNETTPPPDESQKAFDDMDLYFDDGEFDMDQTESTSHFDENQLDDESGQIRDIPAENAKRYEAALERSAPGDRVTAIDPSTTGISRDTSSSSNLVDLRGGDSSTYSGSREPELNYGISSNTSVLTEDNLAAYHDALAEAANYAAANGKFNRQVSFRSNPSEETEDLRTHNVQPAFMNREINTQNDDTPEYLDGYDTFTFDDEDVDDDLMIAEANAEALENDDEGIYGQEFGFYARAHGKDPSDSINGGFFAARGSNGVKRSHSGKANFQEPSLTPITERSEWSTRNSVVGGFATAAQPLPSPGVTQQRLDSPLFEDDMSLSALIKLRRGAFGGSSTSINSLGERSMPGSSPLAHVSSYSFPPPETSHLSKQSVGGPTSIMESEEEDDFDAEQLTLTQNTPRKKIPGSSPTTPQSHMPYLAVAEAPGKNRKTHHRRNSSGADSVSYVRDTDGRWVLERRRTGDDGEQEIVEREYLAGARI